MRKGQNLSLNVIIIAALALLVLVIISLIFMNRASIFGKDTKACETQGGTCHLASDGCPEGKTVSPLSGVRCLNSDGTVRDDYVCCIPISG